MEHNNLCHGCFEVSDGQSPCPSCGYEEKVLEASIYLPPRTILAEKYIIGKVLGQGGFGITYLGWDLNLDMKLAIKEFFPQGLVSRLPGQSKVVSYTETEDNSFEFWLDRFLKEAKTLAQFEQHPNIVTVRDFFKENNTAYMVMSYIEGITLEHYLARAGGRLPYDKTIQIMMPVMDALREVHEAGVMHRDISPDNVFIDNKGRVVLIDFGAARQEISDKSKSISVILKAGYAPEEQYRSRGKQGPWTDVYATGATIYRMLTGVVPQESIDRVREDQLLPPSLMGVKINKKREVALLKALAVDSQNRYADIKTLQSELQDFKTPVVQNDIADNQEPIETPEVQIKAHKDKEPDDPEDKADLSKIEKHPVANKKLDLGVKVIAAGLALALIAFILNNITGEEIGDQELASSNGVAMNAEFVEIKVDNVTEEVEIPFIYAFTYDNDEDDELVDLLGNEVLYPGDSNLLEVPTNAYRLVGVDWVFNVIEMEVDPSKDKSIVIGGTGKITVLISNDSDRDLYVVYISPAESDQWGDDWLGASFIMPEWGRYLFVKPGNYDILILDPELETVYEDYDVVIDSYSVITVN